MIKEAFILWILNTMIALAPPHRPHYEPAAMESHAQADARYREIAEAIINGVFDPDVLPVLGGPRGRQNTAMLVTVWWHGESGFRRDVDLGLGRARLARVGWNDYGRSWCMGQINLGRKPRPDPERPGHWIEDSPLKTPEGWSGRDLCNDRRKCLLSTIRIMRGSVRSCHKLPNSEKLTAYAAGHCKSARGKQISRNRMRLFWRRLKKGRPDYIDKEVLAEQRRLNAKAAVATK
jgi:hypothetical protein